MRITEAELLDALVASSANPGPDSARTVVEMMAEAKMSELRVRNALKVYKAQNRLQVHRVTRPALDGRQSVVPAYTILPATKR